MERTTEDRSLVAITERAAEWYVAHRDGALASSERAEFVAWLQASPLHVREYLSIAATAQALSDTPHLPEQDLQQLLEMTHQEAGEAGNVVPLHALRPPQAATAQPRRSWLLALAASTLIAVVTLLVAHRAGWIPLSSGEIYQVAGDGQGVWRLSDGSILHLNSHSQARVRFSSRERLVELQQGQALFEVSHHSPLQFRVAAGYADVVAVGTRFEVRRDALVNRVTVVEGVVAVQPHSELGETVQARAGQRIQVEAAGVVSPVERADVREVYGWVQRQVEFDQQSLASVVLELNRYALTPINIADAGLAELPISGVFNAYDAESFVDFLRRLPGVKVTAGADRIQVQRVAATING